MLIGQARVVDAEMLAEILPDAERAILGAMVDDGAGQGED